MSDNINAGQYYIVSDKMFAPAIPNGSLPEVFGSSA